MAEPSSAKVRGLPPEPWIPTKATEAEIYALKAVAGGTANEHQQRLAIEWIIHASARTYDLSFRPEEDGRRSTDMAEGRRAVGLDIVKYVNMPVTLIGDEHAEQGQDPK